MFLGDGTAVGPFPKAVRDYDALELTVDKRLSNRWSARASYTISRLYGNYPGLSQTDENGRTSPNVGRSFDYPLMAFDGRGDVVLGRLPTDRPHQFKVQANYELPFGTLLGINEYVASGIPVTREAAAIAGSSFPIQYLGRLSDGRTPTISQTDFTASHSFRLGARSVVVGMDIINLFDQKTAINKNMTQLQNVERSSSAKPTSTPAASTSWRRRNAARPESAVPAGQRLPAAPRDSLLGPVLVLGAGRRDRFDAGSGSSGAGIRVLRPRHPRGWRGPFTLRLGPRYRAAGVGTGPASAGHGRHARVPLDEPGRSRRPWIRASGHGPSRNGDLLLLL